MKNIKILQILFLFQSHKQFTVNFFQEPLSYLSKAKSFSFKLNLFVRIAQKFLVRYLYLFFDQFPFVLTFLFLFCSTHEYISMTQFFLLAFSFHNGLFFQFLKYFFELLDLPCIYTLLTWLDFQLPFLFSFQLDQFQFYIFLLKTLFQEYCNHFAIGLILIGTLFVLSLLRSFYPGFH